jgi:hypothetical protein
MSKKSIANKFSGIPLGRATLSIMIIAVFAIIGLTNSVAQSAVIKANASQKPSALAFHDTWLKLWEDHIVWTRMVIIGIIDSVPGIEQAKARLLKNYEDMEDSLRPYYGDEADKLGDMIEDHLLIAVEILEAAKAGDTAKLNDAVTRWYANGDEIATQMNSMNPRFWQLDMAKKMWKDHLDATLAEATARLQADYAADVQAYEVVHLLALSMADFFSKGVIKQFPFNFTANGGLVRK